MAAKWPGTDFHPAYDTTRPKSSNWCYCRQISTSLSLPCCRCILVILACHGSPTTCHGQFRTVQGSAVCSPQSHRPLHCHGITASDAEVFHAVKEKEDQTPDIFGQDGAMALAFGLTNMGFAAGSLIGPFFAGFIRQQAGLSLTHFNIRAWRRGSWVQAKQPSPLNRRI